MPSLVKVYIATSLDGFIAGDNDDLSWLPQPKGDDAPDYGFHAFMKSVGALLLGRRTYDTAAGFDGPWPYGTKPVLVATHRTIPPLHPTVHAVSGGVEDLVRDAKRSANGHHVYIDGGALIRQAMDAGLVDEIIITLIPVVLGSGVPLFAGTDQRHHLELLASEAFADGLVQLTYRPA